MSSGSGSSVSVLLALALFAAGAVVAAPGAVPRGERIGVEIDVKRAGEGLFACRTTVRDLPTSTVIAEPQVEAREGATAVALGAGAGFEVEVQLMVAADGERIDHAVLVRRDGVLTSSQSVTLYLDR
jgi:hypothetical protein